MLRRILWIIPMMGALFAGCGGGDAADPIDGLVTSADGTPIHYLVQGTGSPTLVFVHGWSCDGTYWKAQVDHFAPAHRVVAVDLAGHGESGQAREDYTIEAFGGDVAAVLEELDIHDAVLVGHSMGGGVVVEAALAAPDRVKGLVGIDNFHEVSFDLPEAQIEGYLNAFRNDFRGTCVPWVMSMFPAGADSALARAVAEDMASAPPAVAISAMHNLLQWYGATAPQRLPLLRCPLMCINSDNPPTDEAGLKDAVPGYQVRYMPGRGHFLMKEDPQEFNRLLSETVTAMLP
ncbi:MAG: alpha/beta hydrolase [bacterium]